MDQLWRDFSLWIFLALVSGLLAFKLGISVALVELLVGIAAGNTIHPEITPWVNFLAALGAVVLTFLAGAELETEVLRQHWKASLGIGFASFLLPFLLCWLLARHVLGWDSRAAQIAGLALSTTSVAVVYAVMVETRLNEKPLGKLILAACFVTDLGTVVALGLLFTSFDRWFWIFAGSLLVALPLLRHFAPLYFERVNSHISEPEVKFIYLALGILGLLAIRGGSEAVLPAYLLGMALADSFLRQRQLILRMRATTFALLTPFYFLKAGSLVDLRAVGASFGLVVIFFLAKVGAKFLGVSPVAALFRFSPRTNVYTTLLMSTGLTFGSIASLYGLTHGFVTQAQYSLLVTAVILTALVPTLIAQRCFAPRGEEHRAQGVAASRGTVLEEHERPGGRSTGTPGEKSVLELEGGKTDVPSHPLGLRRLRRSPAGSGEDG